MTNINDYENFCGHDDCDCAYDAWKEDQLINGVLPGWESVRYDSYGNIIGW